MLLGYELCSFEEAEEFTLKLSISKLNGKETWWKMTKKIKDNGYAPGPDGHKVYFRKKVKRYRVPKNDRGDLVLQTLFTMYEGFFNALRGNIGIYSQKDKIYVCVFYRHYILFNMKIRFPAVPGGWYDAHEILDGIVSSWHNEYEKAFGHNYFDLDPLWWSHAKGEKPNG